MPLADNLPVIDNRRFEDLVAEARTRIPRYTPEWTDFNPGDPGFALVELFAWMTELLTYRLAQVPELNYIKFLEMIGLELEPAKPAEAVLVFPVQASFANPVVLVPQRTQVSAPASDGGSAVVFETTRPLTALHAALDFVQAFDGYAFTDVTADNAEIGSGFQPFGPLAKAESALLLGLTADMTIPPGSEIALAVWPASTRPTPPPTPCGGGASPVYAPATVKWEYWNGTQWRALKVLKDETLAFTRLGFVLLKAPAKNELVAAKIGLAVDKTRFWLRAHLVQSAYEAPPALQAVRTNAVPALAAQTATDEVLGGSDGSPNQTFTLASAPVVAGSLSLQVDEGEGFVTWTEVEDFFGAGANDKVYVLDRTTGQVRFGDGTNGGIPVANIDRAQTNIVARIYQFGGGARSNVDAGTISTLMTSIEGIDAGKVANPFAADGGTDEETLAAAKLRAPQALKSHDRAVTAADYELLAREAGPVARAKALPLVNPNFPGTDVPGCVTVIVVPDVATPRPTPSPGLLRTVCAFLDQRRVITTELYVIGPTYSSVDIAIEVVAEADADVAVVQQTVETAITTFLDPLHGGSDGLGWPFGGTVFFSDIYRCATVPGVLRIAALTITLDGTDYPPCSDVTIPAGNLLAVDNVGVTVDTDPTLVGGA
jgi:predicted phage baseplate assembly protein